MTRSAPIVTGLLVLIMGCGGGDVAPEPGGTGKSARPGTKEAVDKAVKYLSKNRNKDGSYGKRPCVGITGLCVGIPAVRSQRCRPQDRRSRDATFDVAGTSVAGRTRSTAAATVPREFRRRS